MGESTKIQWCDHSWSPWRGCTKISAGCANCYAELLSRRNLAVLGEWGPQGKRTVNADWRKPLAWNRAAAKAGVRRRVFPSLCDPFEEFVGAVVTSKGEALARSHFQECLPGKEDEPWGLDDLRFEFLNLIRRTPCLDWLVLTKRPEYVLDGVREFVEAWGGELAKVLPNLWLGVSVEDQQRADERIPHLLQIPARVRWLSVEPLLGPVDLCSLDCGPHKDGWLNALVGSQGTNASWADMGDRRINWVVVGGESGPGARPCDIAWIRSIVAHCKNADVPVFVKQWGGKPVKSGRPIPLGYCPQSPHGVDVHQVKLIDPKGGDPSEWPEDLRVREWPWIGSVA